MILSLFFLGLSTVATADEDEALDASAHVLQAELALHRQDYLEASREYAKAAALSESVDIARQATRIATSYGFDEEALESAKRWYESTKPR